jgi:hypothetical protein
VSAEAVVAEIGVAAPDAGDTSGTGKYLFSEAIDGTVCGTAGSIGLAWFDTPGFSKGARESGPAGTGVSITAGGSLLSRGKLGGVVRNVGS